MKKGELALSTIVIWIISIGALILAILLIVLLQGKGNAAIDYLQDIFRFGK